MDIIQHPDFSTTRGILLGEYGMPYTILIVEDDENIAKYIQTCLPGFGRPFLPGTEWG